MVDPGSSRYEHEPQSRIQRELAKAITYAVYHGAGVISLSLGYELPSLAVRQALQNALNHNVAVLASSGNSGDAPGARRRGHAPYSFHAHYLGALGLAAGDQHGAPAGLSRAHLSGAAAGLSAQGVAGPGAPRTGLRRTKAAAQGLGAGSHFGGGTAAVPPEPVAARGPGQLLLFCVLAAGCLAMIVVATSRLILMRRPAAASDDQEHGLVTSAATWREVGDEVQATGSPPDGSHLPVPPRFPWSAAPPGRHAVPLDQPGAPRPGE